MLKLLVTFLMLADFSPAASVILNPSFEDSDMSVWTRTAITGIRPWGLGSASPHEGSNFVFAVDEASISQNFGPLSRSSITLFTFWVDRPLTSSIFVELSYSDGGSSAKISMNDSTGPGWGQVDVIPLIDPSKQLIGISIIKLGTGVARLDDFHLTAVPEVTALSFSFSGVLLLLSRKRPDT